MTSPRTFPKLQRTLAYLYSDSQRVRIVLDDAGIDHAHISFYVSAMEMWHTILSEAEKTGKVEALLATALSDYTDNAELLEACEAYRREIQQKGTPSTGPAKESTTYSNDSPNHDRSRNLQLVEDPTEDIKGRSYYAKSWALVVGINRYSGGIPRLTNARNDAQAIGAILRDQYLFDEVHELYDEQATHKAIMSWLRDELPRRTGENDRVIFFFAGHGVTQDTRLQGKRGYLIPYDAEADKYADYIDMRELLHACGTIAAKHIFIILDCCFSGIAAVSARATPSSAPNKITDSYLRRITEKGAWQILTAGDSDDMVTDSSLYPGHSVFTGVLLQGLEGGADQNRDDLFTATDLATYVKPLVTRQSAVATGRSQAPFFNYLAGSGQGDFVFIVPRQNVSSDLGRTDVAANALSLHNETQRGVTDIAAGTAASVVTTRKRWPVWKQVASFLSLFIVSVIANGLYDYITGKTLDQYINTPAILTGPEATATTAPAVLSSKTSTLTLMPTLSPIVEPTGTPVPPTWTRRPQNDLLPTATPTLANMPTLQAGATLINPMDGAIYAYVPAGEFLMGSSAHNEKIQHTVFVDDFWIMQTEVTNDQYKRCVDASKCTKPDNDRWREAKHAEYPVANVNWMQANRYAEWSGGRLPTESEWEKACRGVDGFIYPWGNRIATPELLNFYGSSLSVTTVVGSYPAGTYGLYDMSGNVWEWTSNLDKIYLLYTSADSRMITIGGLRALRGGSFAEDHSGVRCAYRSVFNVEFHDSGLGFRVVRHETEREN